MLSLSVRFLTVCIAISAAPAFTFAQAGSAGGVAGKQGKSVSGSVETQPTRRAPPSTTRRASSPVKSSCGQPVGTWTWWNGGLVTVSGRGTISKGSLSGKWACGGSQVVMIWDHGYTDRMKLSADGSNLSGTNNLGFPVGGKRTQ